MAPSMQICQTWTSTWMQLAEIVCDRVGLTLILSIDATTRDEISFLLTFFIFSTDVLSLGRWPRHHLPPIAESHPTEGVGLAAGGQSARRSWLTLPSCMAVIEWGPVAAAARDDGVKLGSCPSLLQPPRYIQITPVICVGIPKGGWGCPR